MSLESIAPIMMEPVSQTTLTNSVQLGTRISKGGVDYVYVYNGGAASIAQGQMGFLTTNTTSLSSGYTVTVTNAVSQVGGEFAVGVAHNAAIAAVTYGWLATRGPVFIVPDSGEVSMNAGDLLTPGLNGGFVVAPATLSTSIRLGIAINSIVTTVGSGKAIFKSPLFG